MNHVINISDLRQNYLRDELTETTILQNPIEQFNAWFQDALKGEILEPNAMHLATIANGKPTGRIVLLKDFDEKGFVFYTNYASNKGKEIEENPNAALTFFWDKLERQVRIEGKAEKVSEEQSDSYYHSRPRSSQIGAWVSAQSHKVENRDGLESKQVFYEEKFKNLTIIPRPPHWGGYRIVPEKIEFWQGRTSRLHDRLLFTKIENSWKIERLEP